MRTFARIFPSPDASFGVAGSVRLVTVTAPLAWTSALPTVSLADRQPNVWSEGIRISTLEELSGDGEEVFHGIHELVNETCADIPSSDEWTSIPFGEWQRLRTEAGERSDKVWAAVEDGRVVGVGTLLQRQESAAYAGHTGVARTHRGRDSGCPSDIRHLGTRDVSTPP